MMDVKQCTLRPAVATADMGTEGGQTVWCCESVRVVIGGKPAHTIGRAEENQYPFDLKEPVTQAQAKANAALWAEATTVSAETGQSPRQLAQQVEALREVVRFAMAWVACDTHGEDDPDHALACECMVERFKAALAATAQKGGE